MQYNLAPWLRLNATPKTYPPPQIGMNYTAYRCLEESNFDVVDDEPSWTQSSSPWSTPRECWWPVDSEDERLCTAASGSGKHKCEQDSRYMNVSEFRWCGSNYDALGNARFAGGVIEGVEWDADRLVANATFVRSLNWGYTTFDNIFVAFLSIFQSITMEGWSDILYQVRPLVWFYCGWMAAVFKFGWVKNVYGAVLFRITFYNQRYRGLNLLRGTIVNTW